MSNPWFRLHADMLSDEKVLSLAFSDRWFFVAVMCLKCEEMQDKYEGENLDRKVAIRLGISRSEAEELKARLMAEGLICGNWIPVAWDKRQYKSDSSAERVAKYRERRKKNGLTAGADLTKQFYQLIDRDGKSCSYCSSATKLCVDHIVPIARGGTDDLDNLCLACKQCNSGKAGRTPEEAGYAIVKASVKQAYSRYVQRVTVTVTPPDTDTDTENNRFDEFWDCFQDKRGKEGARRVWNRKRLDNIADEVIAGAKRYVATRGPDRKFWKQAQGWLNDGRWADETNQPVSQPVRADQQTVFVEYGTPEWAAWWEYTESIKPIQSAAGYGRWLPSKLPPQQPVRPG